METFPVEHPDLFDERPPIRLEDIQRLNTHVQTLELQYEATKWYIEQRAEELLTSWDDWSDEDFEKIQDLKSRLDGLEDDFFWYSDLPYDIARSFTLIQSKYYRYLSNIDLWIFWIMPPEDVLRTLSAEFTWWDRDENGLRRNFEAAQLETMDYDIFEEQVLSKYDIFSQRGKELRERLNIAINENSNDYSEIDNDINTLTWEIRDFNETIRHISFLLPRISREEQRDLFSWYSNPYTEWSPEFELYDKHERLYKITEVHGRNVYEEIHSMAFEIWDLERQNNFEEWIQWLEWINLWENAQEFFQLYRELLGTQSQSLGYGASNSMKSQALSNVGKVFEIFENSIREYGRNEYIQTVLDTEWYFYDPISRAHYPIQWEQQTSISDFSVLVDIYDWIIPQETLEQETTNYIVSESSFEWGLWSNIQFNLDNEEFRRFRPDVRGLKIWGLDSIFTRDDDRVLQANEMAHVAFSNMMWDNELHSFLWSKDISHLTGEQQIPAKNIAEIDELLSDMSSLNSLELNEENRDRIVEEILRIFAFIFALDWNNNIDSSNYDATAQVMKQVIQDILLLRWLSQEEIEWIFSISSLENTRSFIEWLEFSDEEILIIQQRYLEVWKTSLLLTMSLRDRVIIAESIMDKITPDSNLLNKFEKELVQAILQEFWYYDDIIDGIWWTNTQNAYLEYTEDRSI